MTAAAANQRKRRTNMGGLTAGMTMWLTNTNARKGLPVARQTNRNQLPVFAG
jgi:hypothetical protein